MKRFKIFSGYRQFYVADSGLNPPAPEVWTDTLIKHHNTLKHIVALCPEGDISARITSCGPADLPPDLPDKMDFEIETSLEVPSGKIGIFGWPYELQDEYEVEPGVYAIYFRGYATEKTDLEEDFYVVLIRRKPLAASR